MTEGHNARNKSLIQSQAKQCVDACRGTLVATEIKLINDALACLPDVFHLKPDRDKIFTS
jgi:hypothetical protein